MIRSEPGEPAQIDDVRKRLKRLAACVMVFAGQAAKPVWIVGEADADPALTFGDRRLAARAPRTARFLAVKCSVKWHETLPRKTPGATLELHEAAADPSPIRSLVKGVRHNGHAAHAGASGKA